MERITERLYLATDSRHGRPTDTPNPWSSATGRYYSFELCRKQTLLGELSVDQWWMDLSSVYDTKDGSGQNRDAIVDLFRALSVSETSTIDDGALDSYILAKLFPYVRNYGSRRVFSDANLTPCEYLGINENELLDGLEDELAASRDGEMDRFEFRDETAKILGPPEYDDAVWVRYNEFAETLLSEGRSILCADGEIGLADSLPTWQTWMQSIGRRSGKQRDKQVLDVLSYESRAALHRAYSATWCRLLARLACKYSMSDESLLFHQFWNLEQSRTSSDPRAHFHLFHGHVFALHPGSFLFIQTRTGTALMGEWLRDPRSGAAFRRLLNGLYVAVNDYARRKQIARELRRRESQMITGFDLETVAEDDSGDAVHFLPRNHRRHPGPDRRDD